MSYPITCCQYQCFSVGWSRLVFLEHPSLFLVFYCFKPKPDGHMLLASHPVETHQQRFLSLMWKNINLCVMLRFLILSRCLLFCLNPLCDSVFKSMQAVQFLQKYHHQMKFTRLIFTIYLISKYQIGFWNKIKSTYKHMDEKNVFLINLNTQSFSILSVE